MSVIFDIILIIIPIIMALIAAKRGFIKTVGGLLCIAASLIVTLMFAGVVARPINDNFTQPKIQSLVSEELTAAVGSADAGELISDKVTDSEFFQTLESWGVSADEIVNNFSDKLSGTTEEIITNVSVFAAEKLAYNITYAVVFLIMSVVVFIICKIIIALANLIAKLPVLKQANGALGFVTGLAEGIIISCVVGWAAAGTLPYLAFVNNSEKLSAILNNSFIVGLFK